MVRHERVHGRGDRIPQEPVPRAAGDRRKKYQDVRRNPRVAFLVDDLESVNPWSPRGIEVRGEAEVLTSGGEALGPSFAPEMFRIRPRRIVSWGINGYIGPAGRSVA